MPEQRYRWKNRQLREHVAVIDGKKSPTVLLKNAVYLNQSLRKWLKANIWIYADRIIYVGTQLPLKMENCEVVDCQDYYIVPGYIEPHSHPFQLYNPHSFADYASQRGTTTMINDNRVLILSLENKKAFTFLEEMKKIPVSMYWWCRYDSQSEIHDEEAIFSHASIKAWLDHDAVLQGGELTGWPKLLDGDDLMLHWIQETKRKRKKVEGHFPGASERTLAKLKLLGADCDHEAMTGKDVLNRLMQGYTVTLRYSSIRPDLPKVLDEMIQLGIDQYDQFMLTTDGSPPSFYEDGMIDKVIKIAIDKKVPLIDAYNMATINIAKYYNIDYLHGTIATGRIANINLLVEKDNPTPVSVLAKGKWVRQNNQRGDFGEFHWSKHDLRPITLNWELTADDLQFSMPIGIEIENTFIIKAYSIKIDASNDVLSNEHDESFLMLVDQNGKWRVNTIIKGFARNVAGLASSFSNTGDILLIGKSKKDILLAFKEMKAIGGGIVLTENDSVIYKLPLQLNGLMSLNSLESVIEEEKKLNRLLRERGFPFREPIYSLLHLSSTHLPFIRITPQGIYDVINKRVLFPSIMR